MKASRLLALGCGLVVGFLARSFPPTLRAATPAQVEPLEFLSSHTYELRDLGIAAPPLGDVVDEEYSGQQGNGPVRNSVQLLAAMKKCVGTDADWSRRGALAEARGTTIAITNTNDMHRRISEFLDCLSDMRRSPRK